VELERSGEIGGYFHAGRGLRGRSLRYHQEGQFVKLVDYHIADGHGTIEWIFGGTDVDVFKTGKPFSVRGVSVIEVDNGRISRNLDYYDAAAIMKQVGVLPDQKK